jgi:AcrR family transcriptional regulator
MPGNRLAKDKKISAILESALLAFLEKGYDGVTMEEIADRAGMARATVYNYFPFKDGILAAVRNRFFEPIQVMMKAAGRRKPVTGLQGFITDYLTFWAKHPHEQEFYVMGTMRALRDRTAWPFMNAHVAEMINWYEMMLWRGVRDRELIKHNTRARATALFCAVEGAVPYVTMAKLLSVKKAAKRIESELLDGLVAGDERLDEIRNPKSEIPKCKSESKSGFGTERAR